MICDSCKREHVIEGGPILVDGVALDPRLIETMVEIGCRHALLVPKTPHAPDVRASDLPPEPDAPEAGDEIFQS